ncbi:MAG: GNAT family N-acetyltransferase [Wujia sp.]
MITLIENEITTDEYLCIRSKVNWRKLTQTQADLAIHRSLYFIKAVGQDGELLGMGRIVGDGAVICYIQDLVVVPEAQGKGIGSMIIKKLIAFVEGLREDNSTMMLCLMCAKGREPFYLKHGFTARPSDSLGPGMIQYLE